MLSAGDFRNGKTFEMDGQVFQVVEFQHVKPGKGAAFVRTKYKNVITGAVVERSFNPTDQCEEAVIERRNMQYLYADGDLDEALVRDQNALASSLRTASASAPADPARLRRIALAAAGVCLLGVILVQSVSLALCVFLARWGRDGE